MARTTSQLRGIWVPACGGPMTTVNLYGGTGARVTVDSRIVQALDALNNVLARHKYVCRKAVCGAYNCRPITGGTSYSLHAYGIAIDINWDRNPYGSRLVTDMPSAMVNEIKALRTNGGHQVWRWGGDYSGNKDAMHFEVIASPAEVALGIRGGSKPPAVTPPKPSGEFTMDAEAKKAFDALNKRLDGLGGGQSLGITNQAEFKKFVDATNKRFTALEKQLDEAESRASKRWGELFKSGAPRK